MLPKEGLFVFIAYSSLEEKLMRGILPRVSVKDAVSRLQKLFNALLIPELAAITNATAKARTIYTGTRYQSDMALAPRVLTNTRVKRDYMHASAGVTVAVDIQVRWIYSNNLHVFLLVSQDLPCVLVPFRTLKPTNVIVEVQTTRPPAQVLPSIQVSESRTRVCLYIRTLFSFEQFPTRLYRGRQFFIYIPLGKHLLVHNMFSQKTNVFLLNTFESINSVCFFFRC